ncbi:MAG: BlaI/MecI/CopY family transcriptional regulator [Gemmatimonadota bacterium]
MAPPTPSTLTRRERQVMEVLHRLRDASVAEVVEAMPEEATYSAVRAVLRTLREKGLVRHRRDGHCYVYSPALSLEKARHRAVEHLAETFFDGSLEAAALAILKRADVDLSDEVRERVAKRIRRARSAGR